MLELAQIPVAPATQEQSSWRHSLVGLSAGAGAIHLYAIPEHLKEYWPFAAFFAGVAAFQAAWALAVLARPQRGLYGIGAVASAGLITLWALSRTSGLPLGPEPWHPEAASLPDVLAVALESGLILTIRARRGSRHPKPGTQPRRRRWTSHRARTSLRRHLSPRARADPAGASHRRREAAMCKECGCEKTSTPPAPTNR